MSLLIEDIGNRFAQYVRKIKCPRHYILKPGGMPFVMERIPALRNIKEGDARALKLQLWQRKKDINGKYIQNFKDYYQPDVSAAFVKETIYSSTNLICIRCRRCLCK